MERIWLDVPFSEKDAAKAEGARWDPDARRWYAPRQGMAGLEPWAARPPLPDEFPGEDRHFGHGLFVDLVPSSCWFTNVRSAVAEVDWERLRRAVCERAQMVCEVCGVGSDREARRWLEVHERWDYLEEHAVQRLRRLICLCTPCHTATHIGLAEINGKRDQALAQLCWVNSWTIDQAEAHIAEAFSTWQGRSARYWELDVSILTGAGITIKESPTAGGRQTEATSRLTQARMEDAHQHRAGPVFLHEPDVQTEPITGSTPDPSRNHERRPGYPFTDTIDLPGWDDQSFWGFDEGIGSFFAQLWRNGSQSDEPEIWLSGVQLPYPGPGCIALDIVGETMQDPPSVVRALAIADPVPQLRPGDWIAAEIMRLATLPNDARVDSARQALEWVAGRGTICPGSRWGWNPGAPTAEHVVAEGHLVTGRLYRFDEDRTNYYGADSALSWALGHTDDGAVG